MSKTLVIVESPAKARTISQFLGKGYEVKASFGHIRDLPEKATDVPAELKGKSWAKLGVNVEGDFEPVYIVTSDKKAKVSDLKASAKDCDTLLLATDEDREGESISWHIREVLKPKKGTKIQRIVFHEITPEAIAEALANPRDVDEALVRAQETRRILDRLYGYTLSPLLWKKVAPKLSAGRVQSVAVRLVVMRERERRDFISVKYAGITADLAAAKGPFKAELRRVATQRLADGSSFSNRGEMVKMDDLWLSYADAEPLATALLASKPWTVTDIEKAKGVENPPPPFMTSTLQQEAIRKYGFTAQRTMQIAQNLYEGVNIGSGSVGLITYMRTDSLNLAERALREARQVIGSMYGEKYVPAKPRTFKSKAKNAQEAHEAIRPTDLSRTPQSIRQYLSEEQFKLYDLIWKRTIACQMSPAEVERTKVEVTVEHAGKGHIFGASGKAILFPGFLRAYVEGSDDPNAELGDKETILPELNLGDVLNATAVTARESATMPPARYTEASLVKKLEDEGIGRPSTYASIIGTIQDRGYVFKSGTQLVPTFTAFAVTGLLEDNFANLVDLKFTAEMENELDEIANGDRDMVKHLKSFYYGAGEELGIAEKVDKEGPNMPFPHIQLGDDIVIRIGRNGPFIQRGEGGAGNTASIPEDMAPAELTYEKALELIEDRAKGPEAVGLDPSTGQCVFAKKGRFGPYLEVGLTPAQEEAGEAPRRVSIPPGVDANKLDDPDLALILTFPKTIGNHPETGEPIVVQIGRYGAYLSSGEKRANAGDWRAAAKISVEAALELFATGGRGQRKVAAAMKEMGELEGCAGPVRVMEGRYGPYVTDGTTNATIPKGMNPLELTPEQAVELIQARAALGPPKKKRGASRGRTSSRSSSAKASGSKTSGTKSAGAKSAAKKKPTTRKKKA